eukprot:TRINITY_DN18595_c1_g1_i1.p1 TRINITY_DN18595_c1_g1~~TRINITY_DN18595_c1_g1_i1.p1  ORF type:complete len:524 (+),score=90.32 TRINITY_DN18595_c1_g1_i1:52-1623(+)
MPLSNSRRLHDSCPDFDRCLIGDSVPDPTGVLSPGSEELDGDRSPRDRSPRRRKDALGASGWFEKHLETVGAPRPERPKLSTESEKQRADALAKVSCMAERYQTDVSEHCRLGSKMRATRSSPELCSFTGESSETNCEQRGGSTSSKPRQDSTPSIPCLAGIARILSCGYDWLPAAAGSFRALFSRRVEGPQDPGFCSSESAVIIFDWDDTICPTSFIMETVIPSLPKDDRSGVLPEDSPDQAPLAAHAHLVGFVLRAARRAARVAIVSNSLSPWVEASSARYMPGLDLEDLLQELDVPVYYSRRHVPGMAVTYQVHKWEVHIDRTTGGRIGVDIIPGADGSMTVARIEEGGLMNAWNLANPSEEIRLGDRLFQVNGKTHNLAQECRKQQKLKISVLRAVPDIDPFVEAKRLDMEDCLERFYGHCPGWKQNVISIGDSNTEHDALKEVLRAGEEKFRNWRPTPLCKTVNLLEHPSLEQLSNELRILLVWLSHMVKYNKDFDLPMVKLDDLEQKLFQASAEPVK